VVCRNGVRAVSAGPHIQRNGRFAVYNLTAYSCYEVLGYSNRAIYEGDRGGSFSNDSIADGLTAVYGTRAQGGKECGYWPACQTCAAGDPPPTSWRPTVRNTRSLGFPPPSNRTVCKSSSSTSPKTEFSCPYVNSTALPG